MSEVPVRITFQSDWDEAEHILLTSAGEITADAIKETGEEPFVRAESLDDGLLMRLSYKTRPADYAENVNDIVKVINGEFRKSDKVVFCYPNSEVVYSLKIPPASSAATDSQSRGK